MKTLEELGEFYNTELMVELQGMEAKRRQVIRKSFIAAGVIGGLGLIGAAVLAAQSGGEPIVLIFPVILCLIIGSIAFAVIGKGYKAEFKQRIISRIVQFLEPGLSYHPDSCIDERTFEAAGLFNHSIDRYSGEDMVQGRVGQTQIAFSEVHAEYKTTSTDSKGRTQTHWHTIFRGLFFIGDFNKHFSGRTVVLPDTAEKLFGGFGQLLQSWNMGRADLVKLEDPDFERAFVVYGSDQIEARYILSTSLMRRILDFQRKTGLQLHLSFTGSTVCVALPMSKNCFEPAFFGAADFSCIAEYYRDLSLVIGIVDDLNLNTRIWSKT